MKSSFKLSAVAAIMLLSGCFGEENYTALTLTPKGDHFIARGVIDQTTPDVVRTALRASPEIKTIVMQFVPGSVDDHANLIASRLLRENGITTIVPSGGFIASGGTDMFLAGADRKIGSGACLGVHSWGGEPQGADVPKDDPQHQLYLDYYDDIGIDGEFYWYTLSVARAEGMHFMTNSEIIKYDVATEPLGGNRDAEFVECETIARTYENRGN